MLLQQLNGKSVSIIKSVEKWKWNLYRKLVCSVGIYLILDNIHFQYVMLSSDVKLEIRYVGN